VFRPFNLWPVEGKNARCKQREMNSQAYSLYYYYYDSYPAREDEAARGCLNVMTII
jgi:hypothetical protein